MPFCVFKNSWQAFIILFSRLLNRKLKADFGEDDEFLVLEPQCFDLSDKKYLYKFCPFDKIVQILKVNKDETLVG